MSTSSKAPDGRYDVAILGAGIAGGILGAVLARNGLRVLLLDAGMHPRFAVGESTIPHTSTMSEIIAERYQVPEIAALSNFEAMRSRVSPMSGQKRNFGFVYHEEGKPQNPDQINQEVIPGNVEMHLYRQDVDAYFYYVAVRYGAEGRMATRISDIEIDPASGVTLLADSGERFEAKFLVDGSGFRSPVAQKLGLRDEPTRARHHCRSLFTHMVGVTPFDDATAAQKHTQSVPWHQGTLHHVFKGGWLWVIPFDNHDTALNPLCSVGLSVDERMFPTPDGTPQQEFDGLPAALPGDRRAVPRRRDGAALGPDGTPAVLRLENGRRPLLPHRACGRVHRRAVLARAGQHGGHGQRLVPSTDRGGPDRRLVHRAVRVPRPAAAGIVRRA